MLAVLIIHILLDSPFLKRSPATFLMNSVRDHPIPEYINDLRGRLKYAARIILLSPRADPQCTKNTRTRKSRFLRVPSKNKIMQNLLPR